MTCSTPDIDAVKPFADGEGAEAARRRDLTARVRPFLVADHAKAAWQIANTVTLYVLVWYAAYRSLEISYALTVVLAVPAAGLTLRIWVLQHDLGHGSLLRSTRISDAIGSVFGVITLLPYHHWRRIHHLHHSHFGNLDRRGPGYLTTLTVAEYLALPRWRRLAYRIYRNPFVVLVPGALYYFLFQHRVPYDAAPSWKRERASVYATNAAIALVVVALAAAIGWATLLQVHGPILFLSSAAGSWIFVNQHSFERSYWAPQEEWSFVRSALEGSSFLRLPAILNWFTANVGYHHVHHLSPKIPNYHLRACHQAIPELRAVEPLRWEDMRGASRMALWDEEERRMVPFRAIESATAPPVGGACDA